MLQPPVTVTDITAAKKVGKIRKVTAAAILSADAGPSSTVATMGASNPVTYITANMKSIINDNTDYSDSNDDSKVSGHYQLLCTTVIYKAEILVSTAQQVKRKVGPAPFFKPHLW